MPIKTSSSPSPSTSHNAKGGEVTPARKSTCWPAAGLFQGLFGGASLTRCVLPALSPTVSGAAPSVGRE